MQWLVNKLSNYLLQQFPHYFILFWKLGLIIYLKVRQNSSAWLTTSNTVRGLGYLVQWSVTQDNIDLLLHHQSYISWFVIFVTNYGVDVHQLIWFQSGKYNFYFWNQFRILVYSDVQKSSPGNWNRRLVSNSAHAEYHWYKWRWKKTSNVSLKRSNFLCYCMHLICC